MDDLMDTIQKVMSDPESMKQLSQIAQSLGISPDAPQPESPPAADETMDFSKLFSPKKEEKKQENGLDISKLMEISRIMEKAGQNDKNIELLIALKPHLKQETQQKADRLVKIFRLMALYPLLKESGLLGGDLSGLL